LCTVLEVSFKLVIRQYIYGDTAVSGATQNYRSIKDACRAATGKKRQLWRADIAAYKTRHSKYDLHYEGNCQNND
jgi:hypothetical protein